MSKARVLIVEDEGIEAMDIQSRLTSMGFSAPEIAFSGKEALRKIEEARPDLVLMDIMLPGEMDGVMAAEYIRARFDIPVIYVTAYADEVTLQRAKITEPYGYIVKPFKERELHITIDMALYKHRVEKRLKESEKWLATTLKSIGDAVIATDDRGLITFMNPIAEGLTGWKLSESAGRNLTDIFRIIHRDTRIPVENPVLKVLAHGHIVGLANHTRLIARNGNEIPIDDSAAPIKDDRGDMLGVILVFRDITEREEAERKLTQQADDLKTLAESLERRVKERTAELASANERLERDIRDRKAAEKKLGQSEMKLREISIQLMSTQETERKRIAGELHDSVAGYLGAIKFKLESILDQYDLHEEASRDISGVVEMIQQAVEEIRRIMSDLRPSMLDDLGIAPSLQWFCREFQKTYTDVAVELRTGIVETRIPDTLKITIFRICQEALNNAAKHSRATRLCLGLEEKDHTLTLAIRDNGQGFDSRAVRRGLGLSTMRERAEVAGGDFSITSAKGKGTDIQCHWTLS